MAEGGAVPPTLLLTKPLLKKKVKISLNHQENINYFVNIVFSQG
jgi:hypothetical protein